jgi:DNA primase catalytic core
MARVSELELERLKREVSVQRLVEARGITLQRHGANFIGRCPFHEDKTPSLVVTPSKNLWHCLGACQVGGSVVDWVMRAEGVSFRHAVELLRSDMGSTGNTAKVASIRALPAPVSADADDVHLLKQVADYYHQTLKESPEALEYLKARGLTHPDVVTRFGLGFSNRTLGLRLPMKNRDAGAAIRGRLQRLGILRESGHEHFNGSLVIPICDNEDNVAEMYGRKITRNLGPGIPLHLYLPGPHKGVFNSAWLTGRKQVILCEALIDALTFWCAGFQNVTASYGVEGFTDEHLSVFRRCGVHEVLIAYDRDDAGDRAAEALAPKLMAEGFDCYRVQFPRGMDANEYALKVGPPSKSLGLVLRQAVWMGKGTRPPLVLTEPQVELSKLAPPPPSAAEPASEPLSLAAKAAAPEASATTAETATEPAAVKVEISSPVAESTPVGAGLTERSTETTPPAQTLPTPPPNLLPVMPKAPEVPAEVKEDGEVVLQLGERRYRVRGLLKNTTPEALKVNLLVGLFDGRFHVDSLDMYAAKARAAFVHQSSFELGLPEEILKRDLGLVLLKLEVFQEEARSRAAAPKGVTLTAKETEEALALLKSPQLLAKVAEDLVRVGLVGEEDNKLLVYLAAVSRKLEKPLAIVVQSTSAAGKSSLVDTVLSLVPQEDRVAYSAVTGQALFYMGDADLKHKVLSLAEEEGATKASYALKLLQSEGQLTIASTGKHPETGRLVTQEYRVEGPVALFLTTTAAHVDEELLNRCLVLSVDEGEGQTRAIHQRQREAEGLEGLLSRKEREAVVKLHQNAQRLLRPLAVVNPYATRLAFADGRPRARRDFPKLLALMRALAFLHQHQRELKEARTALGEVVQYVEVTEADVQMAQRLLGGVLARAQDDMPPQTKRLLALLEAWAAKECVARALVLKDFRFSRREVREALRWGDTQLKVHLGRLVDLERLIPHRTKSSTGFLYELTGPDRSALGDSGRSPVGARSALESDRPEGEDFKETNRMQLASLGGRVQPHARPGGLSHGAASYSQLAVVEGSA